MSIQDILDSIKDESLKALKEEFKELLEVATKDKSDFIKQSANQVTHALSLQAQGKLGQDDVLTLLKKQKKIAQIEANVAEIQLLARIQKVTYRILDIAIDALVKAIVPTV
jgi:phosphoribosyl-ATP pyrophosphohydrolase